MPSDDDSTFSGTQGKSLLTTDVSLILNAIERGDPSATEQLLPLGYRTDIDPCGYEVILIDEYFTGDVVAQVQRVHDDKDYARELSERNLGVACRFFSYKREQNDLQAIADKPGLTPPCGREPTRSEVAATDLSGDNMLLMM